MTESDLRRKIMSEVARAKKHGGASAVAKRIGCSPSYLSDYLAGKRDAGVTIQEYLGVVRKITYQKANGK